MKQKIKKTGKTILASALSALVLFIFAETLRAETKEESRQREKDGYVIYKAGEGISVEALNLTVKPSTVIVFQGTPDPNAGGGSGKFGASWAAYLSVKKKFGDWANVFVQIQSGWGDTVERSLDLFSNVNYNAYDVGGNVRARKFSYEQYFFEKQLTASCGKYNPRDVFAVNKYMRDDDTQFLAWIFNKTPAIEWPADYTFTIHADLQPKAVGCFEFAFNFFEGDSDWQKIFRHGIYTAEVNFKPASLFSLDPEKWDGNYKFYGWLNTRKHTKFTDAGCPPSNMTKKLSYGFGISADQMITETLGLFGVVGWKRPDVMPAGGGTTLEWVWSAGAQVTGKYWKREKDILAFAVGQAIPSGDYKDAGNAAGGEGHIEAYYRCQLNKCFSVSPNVQLVWNPGGEGKEDPVFVYGWRMRMVF